MISTEILIVCQRLPFPQTTNAYSYRILYGIKYLTEIYQNNITIIAFQHEGDPDDYVRQYCDEIGTYTLPASPSRRKLCYISNYFGGLVRGYISRVTLFDYRYSWMLQKKVNEVLQKKQIDLIFVAEPSMIPYVLLTDTPKVAEMFEVSQALRDIYRSERRFFKKLLILLDYFRMRNYEGRFNDFDRCVTPTEDEKKAMSTLVPDSKISVIPFGTAIDPISEDMPEDYPSLLFLGSLNSPLNERAALYLYNEIFPSVKQHYPNLKLYIVGKEPSNSLLQLQQDRSVIVTGYVKDLKPFFAKASVVTLPVHGYGIKTRLLETMTMGKPVITNSEGIHGIDVLPGRDIIIANGKDEWISAILDLLSNKEFRDQIGIYAKKLMEQKYSWESKTDDLMKTFYETIDYQ